MCLQKDVRYVHIKKKKKQKRKREETEHTRRSQLPLYGQSYALPTTKKQNNKKTLNDSTKKKETKRMWGSPKTSNCTKHTPAHYY